MGNFLNAEKIGKYVKLHANGEITSALFNN